MIRSHLVFAIAGCALLACSGKNAKDATKAIVGKGVEVSKGAVTGVAAGIEEGRKQGESADGALIVSTAEELATAGGATVGEIAASGTGSTITILVENKTDKPMRATKLEVILLDKDGVTADARIDHTELTIPPRAKSKLVVSSALADAKVGTIRLYGRDLSR